MNIPKRVMGLGGEIRVKIIKKPRHQKKVVSGLWIPEQRTILINKDDTPRERYLTYLHELTHAALYDSGQHNLLTHDGNEAICDLVATMRLREEGL